MFCKVHGGASIGIEGRMVRVEADVSSGLPSFYISGEVSGEVRESGARIRTAIKNSGFVLPPKRYLLNLAPAGFRKNGTGFDLPAAVAILCCIEQISPELLENSIFIGELSLNGALIPVRGILSIVDRAVREGLAYCFIPLGNAREAAAVSGIQVYGAGTLKEVADHLQGRKKLSVFHNCKLAASPKSRAFPLDFGDILGQESAKRCIEIGAAGWHHLLMIGPPGSGKTMLAERIPYIMGEFEPEDRICITKLYSSAGLLKADSGLMEQRPFRRPHHSVTDKALIGGGMIPAPGEISLAHSGVLFLDEFAEFSRRTIESLRQPLERGEVHIRRLGGDYRFPARPLLIAAMNPCRCGYYPDRERCRCTASQVQSYMGKISGPVLERLDMCTRIHRVSCRHMMQQKSGGATSREMADRVMGARARQKHRFADEFIRYNGEMDSGMIRRYCRMDSEAEEFLERIYEALHLSARIFQKILRVARTISDLENSDDIKLEHLAEAAACRMPDESYGGEPWN